MLDCLILGDSIAQGISTVRKECAGVELYWLSEQDCKAVTEKIKQHFGVEE